MIADTLKYADNYKKTNRLPVEEHALRDAMYKTIGANGLSAYRTPYITRTHERKTDWTVRNITFLTEEQISNVLLMINVDNMTQQYVADAMGLSVGSVEGIVKNWGHKTPQLLLNYYITNSTGRSGRLRFRARGPYKK